MTTFPDDFVWGAATAAYQIEGAAAADGRKPSVWDTFAHTEGKVHNGDTGDVACDHYNRWEADLDLLADLGVQAYRFSTGWSRVMPDGWTPNPAGLDFYDRLVDGLVDRGILPFLTLNHWDLPQALEDVGGWRVRRTTEAFVRYAEVMAERLGDRVTDWMTHNEPWVVSWLGHKEGIHAPGHTDARVALDVAHHLLLSHGMAVESIRANVPNARVGIVLNLSPKIPASAHPADVEFARLEDGIQNRWYLDPLSGRGYPEDVAAAIGWDQRVVEPGDLDIIVAPTDHMGVNFYNRMVLASPDVADDQRPAPIVSEGPEFTEMGWEVNPTSLYDTLMRVAHHYRFGPLYVTENGAAMPDRTVVDGMIEDEDRRSYLERHFREARRAIDDGVDLAGYFVWSLMDNYEWERGYDKRFGIVHVDYDTLIRTPKRSAVWYRDVIAANAIP